MNKSEQLIACLEGEIAKRDARIVELERSLSVIKSSCPDRCEVIGSVAGTVQNYIVDLEQGLAAIKAQGVVMPDVNAAAKALCNRHAMICGVDADDQWKEYSQDFIADAETVLANARLNAAPVQQVGVPDDLAFAMLQRDQYAERVYALELGLLRVADDFNPNTEAEAPLALSEMRGAIRGIVLAAAPAAPAADAGVTSHD